MTRQLGLIFALSMIIAYFILLGLLGEEGFFHARAMRQELQALRQREEMLLLQVDSLQQQKERMSSQDALKDAAFRFGYQEEGEQVFYFTDEGEGELEAQGNGETAQVQRKPFKGLPKPWVALIALAFSSLCTLLCGMRMRRGSIHR